MFRTCCGTSVSDSRRSLRTHRIHRQTRPHLASTGPHRLLCDIRAENHSCDRTSTMEHKHACRRLRHDCAAELFPADGNIRPVASACGIMTWLELKVEAETHPRAH